MNGGQWYESLKGESINQKDLMDAVQAAYGYNKKEAKKYIDSIDDKTKAELIKGFKGNAKKSFLTDSLKVELHDTSFDDYLKNESLNEGRYSDYADDETRANGWWYFTTHGVGPGSVPKDLNVLEVKEGQNKKGTWGDYVRLDGILNTDELDYYDMIELAPVEEEEDFTGFFSDYDFEESLGEEATSNKKFTIKYGKGRPGGDSEVVEFPSAKEAGRYAADHAKGWGFEVTPFDESLNESEEYKTLAKLSKGLEVISYPYGYAVTDGYVNDRLTVNGDTYVLDDGRFKLSDTDKIKINNLIRKGIIKSSTNESLNEDVREVWQVCDLYSGQPIDDYETEEMAKNEAAYLQQMKDEGMFIPWDGPFVVNKTYKRFDESLSEDKTPYGDTTIEDYVSANFSGSDEDKQKFVAEMKKKASGKDYFNGLNMSVKDWESAGRKFGLSMKKNPVTEDVKDVREDFNVDWENNRKAKAEVVGWWKDVEKWNEENGSKFNIDNDYSDAESMFAAIYDMLSELKTANKDLYKKGKAIYNKYAYAPIKEGKASELSEDTVKTSDGKWTNKGKEGTHGKFKTKKEADAQRKAMFANNFKESLEGDYDPSIYEPRQRASLDGKVWWVPYDTKNKKYSTIVRHGRYKTKKECQHNIEHCFDY